MTYTITDLVLSIILGTFLMLGVIFIFLWIKGVNNNFKKLQNEIKTISDNTRKEFERIRFTEKPICKVGDVYSKKFVVTKVKYIEIENNRSSNFNPLFLLHMRYEYELLNLDTKEMIYFDYNLFLSKFIKDNDLTLDETKK